MKSEHRYIAALMLLAGAGFFLNLGYLGFWDPDESRYAEIAREMVESGDWIVPRFNGMPYLDKPPLYYWMTAASFACFGVNEFAGRIPNAILGSVGLLAMFFLGARMFGRRGGFQSGMILATSMLYMALARVVIIDMLLTVCVTLALLAFYTGYDDPARRRRSNLLLFLFVAMGVLAKGPVGAVVPFGVILLFLAVRRDLRYLRAMSIPAGLAVMAVVVIPWYLLISLAQPGFPRYFFFEQNLMGFISGEVHHPKPWYESFPMLLGAMCPWSLFILSVAFALPVREMLWRIGNDRRITFLFIWFVVPFLLFTLSQSKLMTYYLPSAPPLALLLVAGWRGLKRRGNRARILWAHGAAIAVVVVTAIVCAIGYSIEEDLEQIPDVRGSVEPTLAILGLSVLMLAVIGGLLLAARAKPSAAVMTVAVAMLLAIQTFLPFLRRIEDYRCARDIAAAAPVIDREDALIAFHTIANGVLFYTRHPLLVCGKPGEYGASIRFSEDPSRHSVTADGIWDMIRSRRRVYIYLRRQDWEQIPLDFQPLLSFVAGDRFHMIVTNRPRVPLGGDIR